MFFWIVAYKEVLWEVTHISMASHIMSAAYGYFKPK